jgi:hypothetical protein
MEQNQNSIEKEISLLFEAVNLFEKTTTIIEVKVGHHRTISLSLCNICVNKFVGDD